MLSAFACVRPVSESVTVLHGGVTAAKHWLPNTGGSASGGKTGGIDQAKKSGIRGPLAKQMGRLPARETSKAKWCGWVLVSVCKPKKESLWK